MWCDSHGAFRVGKLQSQGDMNMNMNMIMIMITSFRRTGYRTISHPLKEDAKTKLLTVEG